MSNAAVALMRRPAVRRRLQTELAALSQPALSYKELLAFFIQYGAREAILLSKDDPGASSADNRTAARLAAELLPQLVPDNPRLRYTAAIMASSESPAAAGRACYFTEILPAALDVARQQGSDIYTATCGHQMAICIDDWVQASAVRQGLPPPSAVLDGLQQAEAAHRRCKGLLPKGWTSLLLGFKATASPAKACLQHMQQQGDRWLRLTPGAQQELAAAIQDYYDCWNDPDWDKNNVTCHGCGNRSLQLRACGACKEAQYCR